MLNVTDYFVGLNGKFIQSLLLLPIIIVIFYLSLQLHQKRKRKSYALLLAISWSYLTINAIFIVATLVMSSLGLHDSPKIIAMINTINVAMFFAFIYGIVRIHHKVNIKSQLIFIGSIASTVLLGILVPWLGNLVGLLSVGVITYVYHRQIGRGSKFFVSSILLALSLISSTIINLIPGSPSIIYLFDSTLPVAIYCILLLQLLDHSMVIMQSSYYSAITDPLTGLFNRRYFTKYLNTCISKNMPVHVVFSDIDNFKKLNDTQGHNMGDEVLQQVANIIKEEVDGIGIAGRYGGEEMVALVQEPLIDLNELTERIRNRIENETIVTTSIGFSLYEKGIASDLLIKQADNAMYLAKKNGKNQVIQYNESSGNDDDQNIMKATANHG